MDGTPDESRDATVAGNGATARLRWVLWNADEGRARAPWRLLAGGGAFLALLALVALGSAILPRPAAFDGPYLPALYGTALYLGVTAVLVAGLLAASVTIDRRPVRDVGLQFDRQWWRDAAFGLALGVALPTAVFLVELAAGLVVVTGTVRTDADALLSFGGAPVWFALVMVVCFFVGVSVFEELLVRGYLLTNVAEGLAGFWRFGHRSALALATLATAAVFGVLHASNPSATPLSTLNITLFGVLLGLSYVTTERLGVPIGMHLTWNTVVGAGYGFPVSGISVGVTVFEVEQRGPDLLTGGSFGPEGGLVALLALVLGLGLLGWWVRREYGDLRLMPAVAEPPGGDAGGGNHDG